MTAFPGGWLRFLLDIALPERCALCREKAEYGLCLRCQLLLPWIRAACPRCGVEMPENRLCGMCQKAPPPFASALIPFHYAEPVDRMIQNLKYYGQLHLAGTLGKMLALAATRREADLPDLLVPVPLHLSRLRDRGYNQSLEIAREVGRQLSIPVSHETAERIRATPTQTGLGAAERRRNVRGVFSAGRSVARRSVAIVDDVVTSGSTAGELAKTLLDAGARAASVWAVARTLAGRPA